MCSSKSAVRERGNSDIKSRDPWAILRSQPAGVKVDRRGPKWLVLSHRPTLFPVTAFVLLTTSAGTGIVSAHASSRLYRLPRVFLAVGRHRWSAALRRLLLSARLNVEEQIHHVMLDRREQLIEHRR